ncbi:MAG: prephenate dehydrogenase/arogenate dehydrogenase family protein [Gammaproteobacteria bacterium]|nr:prephenate dehydrogenase/arogenate dehydrogenase family protein [Gammaproteobacteria bacterium]
MLVNKIAIIGVGLIGGSLARALKNVKAVKTVAGYGRDENNLKKAVKLGVIDTYSLNIKEVVNDADIVVLATPLFTADLLFSTMSDALKETAIVTDVGSAKGAIVKSARDNLGDLFTRFIPGHPIAGKEESGVEASLAELFDAHRVILTPVAETNDEALKLITEMWQLTGAEVVNLEVEHHDAILAATSHLPHMLAYALVDCLSNMQERDEIFEFAAGGFADFTRIASSHPRMWHDICFSNRGQLLKVMDQFDQHLNKIREAIEHDDSDALLDIFDRAKTSRDKFTDQRKKRNDSPE